MRGETILAQNVVPWFQVEEGRFSNRTLNVSLSADELAAEPRPQLRITLTTKDDD